MIKTTYQTPELRDSNDNVVQEGAFGKNSPLTNATNDGAFDYILNNLEALHDTIGDSAPTLDGNGHVVEPANLAIGDEDGLRIKNNYLKLSGGNVTGIASFRTDLRMLDNQDNRFGGLYVPGTTASEQCLQLYGGTRATGDARLTLYPSGDGHFSLLAYSNNGSNSYELRSDNAGNLNWRGYPLAWKKDYLPLAGGTMTSDISTSYQYFALKSTYTNNAGGVTLRGGTNYADGSSLTVYGKNHSSLAGQFNIIANDGTNIKTLNGRPDGTLTWSNKNIERIESSGTNYIRYVSGLQICWGTMNVPGAAVNDETITFPMPFKDGSSYNITAGRYWAYSKDENYHIKSQSGTGFTWSSIGTVSTNSHSYRYIAIGWWK